MPDVRLTARHALGILLLGIVVMLWVASSFLMRSIFGEDKQYDKPFLVTWINTGTFSLYLIPWALRSLISRARDNRRNHFDAESRPLAVKKKGIPPRSGNHTPEYRESLERGVQSPLLEQEITHDITSGSPPASNLVPWSHTNRPTMNTNDSIRTFGSQDATQADDLTPLTTLETAKLGCVFSMVWFAANYFGNVSLSYTNVASFTIISSLSGFFTLALGTVVGVEKFTMAKLIALIVSIFGVALVATQDTSSSGTRFFTDLIIGDLLALVGAALYGCYTVFLKLKVRNEERVSMPLFFGFVGIFNLVVLWPAIIFLDILGLEPFALPSTRTIWMVVAANAAITFVSDYLWVLAMLMTSPLVVTVGISMSIPLALLGDHILYAHSANFLFFLGAAFVFASFIAINIGYDSDQKNMKTSQVPGAGLEDSDGDSSEA